MPDLMLPLTPLVRQYSESILDVSGFLLEFHQEFPNKQKRLLQSRYGIVS
jgi:hypothetical protein